MLYQALGVWDHLGIQWEKRWALHSIQEQGKGFAILENFGELTSKMFTQHQWCNGEVWPLDGKRTGQHVCYQVPQVDTLSVCYYFLSSKQWVGTSFMLIKPQVTQEWGGHCDVVRQDHNCLATVEHTYSERPGYTVLPISTLPMGLPLCVRSTVECEWLSQQHDCAVLNKAAEKTRIWEGWQNLNDGGQYRNRDKGWSLGEHRGV